MNESARLSTTARRSDPEHRPARGPRILGAARVGAAAMMLVAALTGCSAPRAGGTPEAVAAIDAVIDDWSRAWQVADPALAASGYSDDADFTNAFGFQRAGRQAIEAYLADVFAMDFVMAGRSREGPREYRFLGPDVALVRSTVERVGQETPGGEELGTRRTSHLRVFTLAGGDWRIVSHLISDARATEGPRH